MLFRYEAMDNTGLEVKDLINANSVEHAKAMIREKGFFVTNIKENGFSLKDRVQALDKEHKFSLKERVERLDQSSEMFVWYVGIGCFVIGTIFGAIIVSL